MTMGKRSIAGLCLGMTLALAGCQVKPEDEFNKRFADKPAPEFMLKDLHGKNVALADFKGKVIALSFWASGSSPCRAEIPHLVKLYDDHKDKGFVILGVNAWNEPKSDIEAFIEENEITYPILLEGKRLCKEQYGVTGIPTLFWIDRQGKVVKVNLGFEEESVEEFEATLAGLL